jgi:hypothetical protein
MATIERRSRIIASRAVHVYLSAIMPRVYAIASFEDARSPKTQHAMRNLLRDHPRHYHTESTYAGVIDGKRTYDCIVYADSGERRACFAHLAEERGQ